MATESARQLIEKATAALRRGEAEKTLELAEEAIAADESVADGHQLRGIALTRLSRAEEATIAFRRATEVAPYEAKHFYNLAINLRDRGLADESIQMARETLKVDPEHPGARALLNELGDEDITGVGPFTERVGYGNQEHVLPFMYGFEKAWTAIGYVFLAIAVVLAVLMFVHFPAGPTGKPVPKGEMPDVNLRTDSLSIFVFFLAIASGLLTFMWMFIDMIDRRIRFTWLVPLTICCMLGMNAVPLAMYMFIGRRLATVGVSKT